MPAKGHATSYEQPDGSVLVIWTPDDKRPPQERREDARVRADECTDLPPELAALARECGTLMQFSDYHYRTYHPVLGAFDFWTGKRGWSWQGRGFYGKHDTLRRLMSALKTARDRDQTTRRDRARPRHDVMPPNPGKD
mgnify:CR=1 FL=1